MTNKNVPFVTVGKCVSGSQTQQWTYAGQSLSLLNSNECLSADGGTTSDFMVDEFGNGELTFYGSFVTDFCVAAC